MESQPETNQNSTAHPGEPLPKKHIPPKIWVTALVVVGILIAYFIAAAQYEVWPFTHVSPPASSEVERIGGDEEGVGEIDTSDWQTYRNEEFGFEARYPSTLSLSDQFYFNEIVEQPGARVNLSRDSDNFVVSIQINPAPFGVSAEIIGSEDYFISGIPVKGQIQGGGIMTYITAEFNYHQDYYLFHTQFLTNDVNAEKEFKKILPTFKFIE